MKFFGLIFNDIFVFNDMFKCAKSVKKGEYVMLDYLNYGDLPDGMRAAKDQRGLYLCKCIDEEISMAPHMLEGRVRPIYNLTTHKKAGAEYPLYIRAQKDLTEKKVVGLGTFSGAPAYENVFGYDDDSIYTLIKESERKEKEKT